MNRLILAITTFVISQMAMAQSTKLSGTITDKQGERIDFATITIKDTTGKLMTGMVSDSTGCFSLDVPKHAKLLIGISHIGYKDFTQWIDTNDKNLTINPILDTTDTNLQEVVVTVKTPRIRREVDRMVFNTEKLNATASSALDVLKHTPGVIVQDGDISMLGKGKLIFLMNGRDMMMDANTLANYLKSMSADQLKQIEVMTTPPAKYSAEGNAGVINFVTKKVTNDFFGGYASNQLFIKEKTSNDMNVSLQYKRNKWEGHINAGWGLGKTQTNSHQRVFYPTETWTTETERIKSNEFYSVNMGADYALTKNSSIGFLSFFSNIQPDADKTAKTSVTPREGSQTLKYFETITNSQCTNNHFRNNLHYTLGNIGNGGRLDVNADLLNYSIKIHENLQSNHDEDLSYLNHPTTKISIWQLKADMEMPIGKATLSYGSALSRSKTDIKTNYERISIDRDLNDHFIYRELIFAGYADMKYKFAEKWNAKLGIRGEYGRLDGQSITMDSRTIKHQFDLFPTAYLNYDINDNSSAYMSASSRINRPSYEDINPFKTYYNAYTIGKGNPNLLPEKTYTAEIGYVIGNLSVSANARWKENVIYSYYTIDETSKLTTVTEDNILKNQIYGFDLSYYIDGFSWFDSSIDCSVYTIISRPISNEYHVEKTKQASAFFYTNNNIYFNKKKTLIANIWGQYQTKEKSAFGEYPARYRIDASLKCLLFNKKLSIGIEYQNLLSSHVKSIFYSNNSSIHNDRNPYRVLNLTLSYRFGKKLNIKRKEFGISTNRL